MASERRIDNAAGRVVGVTVGILFFAWLIDYIDRLVITLALPSIGKEFALNKAAQGAIITIFFVTYTIFQVPGGLLADRFGAKKTMTLALTLWSVFTGLTGTAVSYVWLLVVRLFFGACEGIFPGASTKAIAERTTPEARMTANGAVLASNPLGAAIAPLIAAPAIALAGWRFSFFYVAGLGLVMAVVLWFALPKATQRSQPTATNPVGRSSLSDSMNLLRSGTMWKFTLMFFGFDVVSWGLISWVPSYLITVRHLSLVNSGALASIPYFFATLATVLGGLMFDRFFNQRQRWLIVPCMLVTAVFLYFMLSAGTVRGFIVFESLGMFFMFLTFMPILGLPVRALPTSVVGSGSALVNFGGQAGGAIAPLVMGLLADRFGFPAAFAFLVFGALLAAGAALWSPQRPDDFARALARHLPEAPRVSTQPATAA